LPLKIGNLEVAMPVVQAGMGVQVAKSELAAAVARAGGVGCISSVGLGTFEASLNDYLADSRENLAKEIRNARRFANGGVIGVNVMVALANYNDIVNVCVQEKVDIIISGAGLPINLPELTKDSGIKLVPVVSSGRAMKLILKSWHRRYQVMPDAVVIEGPLCGGHMAFTKEQVVHPELAPIQDILRDVKEEIAPYEAEYGRKIPLLGAENVVNADDVLQKINMGFDGVHVGTRFICTDESGIDRKSKEVYAKAKAEDIVILHSPLGLPVKVLRTPLVDKLLKGEKIPFGCPFKCLRACEATEARFCIANALVKTMDGETDEGLFMVGSGIGRVNDIIPAEEFFEPLKKLV